MCLSVCLSVLCTVHPPALLSPHHRGCRHVDCYDISRKGKANNTFSNIRSQFHYCCKVLKLLNAIYQYHEDIYMSFCDDCNFLPECSLVKYILRVVFSPFAYWRPSIGLAVLCFYSKTGFWPSYCQISTDLDTISHTPIVVRNTLVGRLRPRSARGRLLAKLERLCFFVIHVTHPKSYIETTDRCDFGGKPSKWRWGRVISWKILE